ncbi:hypothetical protein RF11_15848 [Thelohanellus kitauei]|uniref:CCHC-type domain-containing protein n=1 Tax=Thelohanellus kitauei TaxID=669202 RepID=A0A0C2I953_THEKT|nr:hypothetical protein RF11_15848 [Thelohanellus kitauei]
MDSESTKEYAVRIQELVSRCEFGSFQDEALRDRFISGIQDRKKNIRPVLLMEPELDFKKAYDTAMSIEGATRESAKMEGSEDMVLVIKRNDHKQAEFRQCFGCGKTDHPRHNCPFKDAICRSCGIKGHIQRVCRKYRPEPVNLQHRGSNNINHSEFIGNISPFYSRLIINDVPIVLEIDTGSLVTVLSASSYELLQSELHATQRSFKSFSGHNIDPIGITDVFVETNKGKLKLTAYVCDSDLNIVGRDWIIKLFDSIPVKNNVIKRVSNENEFFNMFPDLFSNNLGCMKKCFAKISLKHDARPVFLKLDQFLTQRKH